MVINLSIVVWLYLPKPFLRDYLEQQEEIIFSIIAGKLLHYDTFCHLHEDVLEWLLEAEDKLNAMAKVSSNLSLAKKQFDDNSEYMAELDTHQRVVGEVIRKGRHLLSTTLTGQQEKDVRVRQKLLIDRQDYV